MPDLSIRWSELEARKPYASPFGVTFLDDRGNSAGGIAVNGPDLLYYTQFQQAVLRLAGEVFIHPEVSAAPDAQRAWLDQLTPKLPSASLLEILPASEFDEQSRERRFRFGVRLDPGGECRMDAAALVEYQEFQAVLAHYTGRLYRSDSIERVADPEQRRGAWMAALRVLVRRPGADDAMSSDWPF